MAISKNSGSVAAAVSALALPLAEQMGYRIWDVEYVREGADYYLRITLDNDAGITIDDCEAFSRAIDPLLDEADPVPDSYHLEISSPGVEREIRTPAHIEACTGEEVEAHLFSPVEGSRIHRGILRGMDENGNILLEENGKELVLARTAVSRMNTVYNFD